MDKTSMWYLAISHSVGFGFNINWQFKDIVIILPFIIFQITWNGKINEFIFHNEFNSNGIVQL